MRQTTLTRAAERLILETDDYGTRATAADGYVVEQHGTDRHDETVSRLQAAGWHLASDDDLHPTAAAPSDGGIADAPGAAGIVTDGQPG